MPGKAKKKKGKRRGRKAKRAKSASAGRRVKARPSDKSELSKRRATRLEIAQRREVIKRLHIVRRWSAPTITDKLRDKYDVSLDTIKRDIQFIRKEFQEAKKNGEGSLDDIIAEITEGKNERVQMLWNEVAKIEEADKDITDRRERLQTQFDAPGVDVVAVITELNKCDLLFNQNFRKKQTSLKELRETDADYVDCIRKLGITVDLGQDDEDEILVRIRAKRKEHDEKSFNITIGDTNGSSSDQRTE